MQDREMCVCVCVSKGCNRCSTHVCLCMCDINLFYLSFFLSGFFLHSVEREREMEMKWSERGEREDKHGILAFSFSTCLLLLFLAIMSLRDEMEMGSRRGSYFRMATEEDEKLYHIGSLSPFFFPLLFSTWV